MNVFVTGADGFIGSHLVEQLLDEGHSVKALCQYNSFGSHGWLDEQDYKDHRGELELVLGDVRDQSQIRSLMSDVEVVFHLAALIGIPYSYSAPSSYIATNVSGTLHVLEAAKEFGCRVIHTSTSEVYGTAQKVPIEETHRLHPQSPYAASKVAADQLALSYWRSFETEVIVIRPFNTYGPRQSMRAVIPTVITQIANGVDSLQLGDLTPTRDFNYVSDTASGFIAAAQAGSDALGEVINLASQFEISIGDMVDDILDVMGVSDKIEVVTDSRRIRPQGSEVFRLFGDNRKAKRLLDWEPVFGGREGFRKGIDHTAEWFSNSANLKTYQSVGYKI